MKRIVLIALLLPLFALQTKASHILGGEITYKHISSNKYQINLVVYRDCNECLLDGAGGGSSTKNCNKPSLEMKVSSLGTCSGDEIGLIPITRSKIEKILPVCEGVITKCEDNSNYAFGIEAHYYTTIIDFSKYSKYQDCGFELFLRATDRSNEITNLNVGSNAKFYNYTYIYPWEVHNSPQLASKPQMLLSGNKTFSENLLASTENDSISITSEAPMESRTVLSKFKATYSKATPLKVYCSSGDCTPNRRTLPRNGFYLDNKGNVAFTPNNYSENAIVVYQIEKWREINGTMVKISTVRRDIQYIVLPSQNNTPAFADTAESYSVCLGTDFCVKINALDAQAFVGGVPQAPDTVRFTWTTDLKNATIKMVPINQAPYYRLDVCWSPVKKDYKETPYFLRVELKDNACPLNSKVSKVYSFYTKKNPETTPSVRMLQCGHIEVKSNIKKSGYTNEQWLMRDKSGKMVASSSNGFDTLHISTFAEHTLDYNATDMFGCRSDFHKDMIILRNFVEPELVQPIIPVKICEGQALNIELVPQEQTYQLTAKWFLGKTLIGEGLSLKEVASLDMNSKPLTVRIERKVQGIVCNQTKTININVVASPVIKLWDTKTLCYGDRDLDLNAEVRPKLGQWFNRENLIDINGNFQLSKYPITPEGGSYDISYTVIDRNTGCRTVKESEIVVAPQPKVDIQDLTVCTPEGKLNLEEALVDPDPKYTFEWESTDGKVGIVENNFIDLSKLQSGNYNFNCIVTSEHGCENEAGFTIKILPSAKISFTDIGSICTTRDEIDLNTLLSVSPLGGVWTNTDINIPIVDGKVSKDYCGKLNLNYTYDQQGCFDSKNTSFEIICKPDIKITTPEFVCKNIELFEPTANPVGGEWSGVAMRGPNVIVPKNQDEITLVYAYNHNGCVFTEEKTVTLTDAPTAHIPNLPSAICEGDKILINSPISNVADWSLDRDGIPWNGTQLEPTADEVERGTINLSVRANGEGLCKEFERSYSIIINPKPEIDLSELQSGCEPYDFEFVPVFLNDKIDPSSVDITWTFNDPHSGNKTSKNLTAKHKYSFSGSYDLGVKLTTSEGCAFETNASSFVNVYEKPTAFFTTTPSDVISIHDPVMQFNNQSSCADEMRYIWDFGTNNPAHKSYKENPAFEFPKDTGSFTITLTTISEHQCISEFTKDIYINPDIRIFVPTAFSPNQKGPPETEYFSVSGVNVKRYQITVWNRWGQIVYQSTDIDEVWDGKYSNRYCQSGAFGYKILATSESDQEYIFTGVINLLR